MDKDTDTDKQLETTPEQARALRVSALPPLPNWPTSKPGPQVTEPPPGTRRLQLRQEQVVEIGYDQERGKHILPVE